MTRQYALEAAWLDVDGTHVWIRHRCTDGPVETMLPYPAWGVVGSRVEPSISCMDCGMHVLATLDELPEVTP